MKVAFRDWIGRLMRRVGLHWLSGWWDAGTDAILLPGSTEEER